MPADRRVPVRTDRRAVLALAVPALGALVAEPLFLLADSAIVGRLGTVPLAGLGIAAGLLAAAVSVFIFLAYGTTAAVARRMGAGDRPRRAPAGRRRNLAGRWPRRRLAAVALPLAPTAGRGLRRARGRRRAGRDLPALVAARLPAMLVVLAATGVLRGMLDTRTPLVVAGVGALVNAVLNVVLVLRGRLGSRGRRGDGDHAAAHGGRVSAPSSSAAPARRGSRCGRTRRHSRRRPVRRRAARAHPGVARRHPAHDVRGHRLGRGPARRRTRSSATVWGLLALALDALAIAAQALTGTALGAGDVGVVRAATATMVRWGVGAGASSACSPPRRAAGRALFSADPRTVGHRRARPRRGRHAAARRLRLRPRRRPHRGRGRHVPRRRRRRRSYWVLLGLMDPCDGHGDTPAARA